MTPDRQDAAGNLAVHTAHSGAIEHFIVEPAAYEAVVHVLGQLPYGQIAHTMQLLDSGTKPVFVAQRVRELNASAQQLHDLGDVVAEVVAELKLMVTREGFIWSTAAVVGAIADRLAKAYSAATGLKCGSIRELIL